MRLPKGFWFWLVLWLIVFMVPLLPKVPGYVEFTSEACERGPVCNLDLYISWTFSLYETAVLLVIAFVLLTLAIKSKNKRAVVISILIIFLSLIFHMIEGGIERNFGYEHGMYPRDSYPVRILLRSGS